MSNSQFDEVEQRAVDYNISLKTCPTCRSRRVEVEPGSGIYYWAPSTYTLYGEEHPCNCEEQINLERHYLLANIPPEYWRLTPEDFIGDSQALHQARHFISNWEDNLANGIGIEFFSEKMGTGKTMLACLIAKEIVKAGQSVYFIRFDETVRAYEMPYEQRDAFDRRLRRSPILVLDEIALPYTDAQRAFFAAELESLVRHRTSGNGVTILTTNIDPKKMDEQYPRVFSLLRRSTIEVEVGGEDVRRNGDIEFELLELSLNKEAKPIS